jgi:threonine/homoserine/homoserine lactone efflux protein
MSWSTYGEFLVFAVVLVLIPGPDFAVVMKNTLMAGRRRGRWSAVGICSSNALQGTAAATGLSALVVRAQPVFEAIKWAGVCYLAYLGAQALRSAVRGCYTPIGKDNAEQGRASALGGWRQGFLSNITNPKVLVFYLAVLPQFLRRGAAPEWLLAFAWSHAVLSLAYLLAVTAGLAQLRRLLLRRRVRRAMDATSGAVLFGCSVKIATEHP